MPQLYIRSLPAGVRAAQWCSALLLITIDCPVMLAESSESKKIASLATSVGLRAVLPTGAPTIERATSTHD